MSSSLTYRYPSVSIVLHWLMFLIIVIAYLAIELRGIYDKGTDERELMKLVHFICGSLVFALVWIRLLARLILPNPYPARHGGKRIHPMHIFLYLFMVVMPMLGFFSLTGDGNSYTFRGVELQAIIQFSHNTFELIEELHETLGKIGYLAIGIHALVALYTHWRRHDLGLLSMTFFKSVEK